MIRKLNIAFVFIILLMILVKGILTMRTAAAVTGTEPTAVATKGSSTEITLYYFTMPPFTSVNMIARHDGFLADQLRAIFPRMKMSCCDSADGRDILFASFTNDPHGVTFTIRESAAYGEYPCSTSSPGWLVLRLFTLRENPWRYKGPESLSGLERCVLDAIADIPFVKKLMSGRKALVFRSTADAIGALSEKGTCRAMLEVGPSNWNENAVDTQSFAFERGRRTEPLAKIDVYLRVNNRDPEFAKRVMSEFEEGLKRIVASGERRRICEYYGFTE